MTPNDTVKNSELAEVLEAVKILSPFAVQFGSEPAIQVAPATPAPGYGNHPLPADALVRTLEMLLYDRCYAHRLGLSIGAPAQDPQCAARLSAANRSKERWDAGWSVYQLGLNGMVYIVKGERQRTALPGEFILTGAPGVAAQVGSVVSLLVPRESFVMQPGFYYMFSETPNDVWDDYNLLRYYFHCTPECVEAAVAYLTASLNRYQLPFRMKALSDASLYTRTDAMVLYVARRYFPLTTRIVQDMPEAISGAFRAPIPWFARPLQPGIGMAEDPGNGESFGMHRCRLVAEGIADAWRQGDQSSAAKIRAVEARFALNGMKADRPHLNAGSVDWFEAWGETAA
jgi:hypothetical protein